VDDLAGIRKPANSIRWRGWGRQKPGWRPWRWPGGISGIKITKNIEENLPDPFKQIPGHAPILGRRVGLHVIVRRGKGAAQPAHQALVEMGGSGKTGKALDRVGEIMDNRLNTYDRMQLLIIHEIRWRNAISWVRSDLEGKLLLSP